MSFSFVMTNPTAPVTPTGSHFVAISQIGLASTALKYEPDATKKPVTVIQPKFTTAEIVQSNPYPAALNTITVTVRSNVPLPGSCNVRITISNLEGACVDLHSTPVTTTTSGEIIGRCGPLVNHIRCGGTGGTANPASAIYCNEATGDCGNVVAQSSTYNFVRNSAGTVVLLGAHASIFGTANDNSKKASALWDPDSKSLTMHTVGGVMAHDTSYTFQFRVRNPTAGQSSPLVNISSSGISIANTSMVKNPKKIPPLDILAGVPKESEPMEVRGLQTAASFTKREIRQSVSAAGQTNVITVTLQTNVPLTVSSPETTVTIKGLTGASLTGASVAGAFTAVTSWGTPAPGQFQVTPIVVVGSATDTATFTGVWVSAESALKLTVAGADTTPGKNYEIKFSVVNPRRSQSSPALTIEASGIVIQPVSMVRAEKDLAPMFVKGPELIDRAVLRTADAGGASVYTPWPGQKNSITVRFKPTVDLIPKPGARLSIIISGLEGVSGIADGPVAIQGTDASKFSSCAVHANNCTIANSTWNSKGIWNSGSKELDLRVASTLARNVQVEIAFEFTNALVGQDPPQIMVGMTSDFEEFDIAPAVASLPLTSQGTDKEALLIYPSATFTVKAIGQARSTPGATNTITVTFKPQFALTGAKKSTITISGLKGSMTPDKPIKLLDSDSKFNSVAAWDSKAGKLVLTVAPGQVVPADSATTIAFDLLNPKYPQSGPAVVEISASGDVPIAAEAMELAIDDFRPLKVVAAQFSSTASGAATASPVISGTSKAPGAWNTITAKFRPNVFLSKVRNSVITIDGLSGSATEDTDFLPITMVSGSAATFVSPAGPFSFSLSFSAQCKLSDNKIIVKTDVDHPLGSKDPTGSILYFTAGGCKDRWTRILAYDKTMHCATLEVTDDSKWLDDTNKCTVLGKVEDLKVVETKKTGFLSGEYAFDVASPEGGTGLAGKCTVDESGVVRSVSITTPVDTPVTGYGPNTRIKCQRACGSVACTPSAYTEAQIGVRLSADTGSMSVSRAEWRQASGTLKLAVRDELSVSAVTEISFKIRNSMQPQPAQAAFIKASGMTPIGSQKMTGNVMRIDGTSTTVTKVCTANTGLCTAGFTGLPTGRALYTLSAEIQCNAKATNVVVKVAGSSVVDPSVDQPPATCSDKCNEYHRLFSNVDVTSKVATGALTVETTASGVSTDHCGAGENLKVVFILSYSLSLA